MNREIGFLRRVLASNRLYQKVFGQGKGGAGKNIWIGALFALLLFPAWARGQDCSDLSRTDFNCDSVQTAADVVKLLNLVYQNINPDTCFPTVPPTLGELNCDGFRDASDVVLEFNCVFLGVGFLGPCPITNVRPTIADPRDSIIIESKIVAPVSGACASAVLRVRVFITNKDSLGNVTLPLEERSLNGDAYAVLSRPANCGTRAAPNPVFNFLYPQGPGGSQRLSNRIANFQNYHSDSPDSFLFSGFFDAIEDDLKLPPNPTRTLLLEIKFDSVTGTFGQVLFDTTRILDNTVQFVDLKGGRVPVNFVRSIVTVAAPGSLVSELYAAPRSGDPPLTVFFTAQSDGSIDQWIWYFGDGDSALVQNPVHIYQNIGDYTVTLKAIRGTDTVTIPQTNYIHVNAIHADFVGSPRGGTAPHGVNFTDLSTGAPSAWLWNFGDGTTSTGQNPMHTYADTGWFDVTLKASNLANSINTTKLLRYIRVGDKPDLQVTAYGNTRPRPGFDKYYYLRLRNLDVVPATGDTLKLVLPPQVNYLSSDPAGTLLGDTVRWITGTVTYGDTAQKFQVCVHVPDTTALGIELVAKGMIDSAAGEVVLSNNVRIDKEEVVSSVDPNDKTVQPVGCGSKRPISGTERLTYNIFFENKPSATAEAIYVLIVDTLDGKLDWSTLELGPTSHDSVLHFNFNPFNGEMTWFFDSLNLPPNVNPPEGEGFVSYSIEPRPGLSPGTVIYNQAHIRFDYNNWLAAPGAGPLDVTVAANTAGKGDMNSDLILTSSDVVLMLNCAFLGAGNCDICFADVNCDGVLTASDVVVEINGVFLGTPFPCP